MSSLQRLFERFRRSPRTERESEAPDDRSRWLIAGLGNPGGQYATSRHNLGFMTVDRIASQCAVQLSERKFKAIYALAGIAGHPVVLVKPQGYYNASGESVGALVGYYHVAVEKLIVIHDDLDLEAGRLQLKRGGGDAGNRGIRSIIESLGGADFVRVRIGIGHGPAGHAPNDHVLRPMTPEEIESFGPSLDRAAEAVRTIVAGSLEQAMNRFNVRE
jgi:peptidyl-tRNA hydrolase, PTH1 family